MLRAFPNTFVLKIIIRDGDGDGGENNKDGELNNNNNQHNKFCFQDKKLVPIDTDSKDKALCS